MLRSIGIHTRRNSRRCGDLILFCAGLLVIGAGLAVQGQPATTEPIAYIGHGAMFDQNGREIEPSIEFIRGAQAWYRKNLLEKVTKEQRAQFVKFEQRLSSGFRLDAQSRLVLDTHLLDWLINRTDSKQRDRLRGKNLLLRFILARKLPEKPTGTPFTQSLERVNIPTELLQRLRSEGLILDRPLSFSTNTGGQAYRNLCIANGVPIPPDWGTSGWVSHGQLPQSDVFIGAGLTAEVFTYDASPAGMCIALPRFDTGNTIQLLGVICLAKVATPSTTSNPMTSKVCFFDNDVNGTQFTPQVGAVVPFNNFGGGTELFVGGECTDCHAGQNPYIIHPATVLGTLQGLGLPTFGDEWYEPIVKPGWSQNPGPMPSSGACAQCHVAGGSGGQFPHLSTEFNSPNGYCNTILRSAIEGKPPLPATQVVHATMPPAPYVPGSLAGGPHATKLLGICALGSGTDAATRGDPHLTTVDRTNYDFQSAGEFVALRSVDGLEIQMRQTAVPTASTVGPNPHTGLTTCVSLNTAVAARVGTHRVTYQPNLSGTPDPSGLQLRVDGALTTLGARGLDLGSGGRVVKSAVGDGIEIDFPNGVHLSLVPGWWGPPHNKWYINLDAVNFSARQGIMGNIAPGSWLPALPNGTSLGRKPDKLHQRYLDLYRKFADAWRVDSRSSLFDYAPGTSTATFTLPGWPPERGTCAIPRSPEPEAKPLDRLTAQKACWGIVGKSMNADCVFDVMVTGDTGFAKTYLLTQQLRGSATTIFVNDDQDPSQVGAPVKFTASVVRTAAGTGSPAGTVQFTLDGSRVAAPVKLDSRGVATWTTSSLNIGAHQVAASYVPEQDSVFLAADSPDEPHTVSDACGTTVVVSGMHFPNKTCAQSAAEFQAGLLTNFHFTSKCPKDAPLRSVFNVSCQNAPIPGFSTGSVYQGTACCGEAAPPVTIPNLPMQGGNENTPCPAIGVIFNRSDAATSPYLGFVLPALDQQCAFKGQGLSVATVKFLTCAPDPRGKGFGPNASADLTCTK